MSFNSDYPSIHPNWGNTFFEPHLALSPIFPEEDLILSSDLADNDCNLDKTSKKRREKKRKIEHLEKPPFNLFPNSLNHETPIKSKTLKQYETINTNIDKNNIKIQAIQHRIQGLILDLQYFEGQAYQLKLENINLINQQNIIRQLLLNATPEMHSDSTEEF